MRPEGKFGSATQNLQSLDQRILKVSNLVFIFKITSCIPNATLCWLHNHIYNDIFTFPFDAQNTEYFGFRRQNNGFLKFLKHSFHTRPKLFDSMALHKNMKNILVFFLPINGFTEFTKRIFFRKFTNSFPCVKRFENYWITYYCW